MVGAVVATASILLSQYAGDGDAAGMGRTLRLSAWVLLGVATAFSVPTILCPERIMYAFSPDTEVVRVAAAYLRAVVPGFLPLAATGLISAYLRTVGEARWPMRSGIAAMVVDAALNFILIYGLLGAPAMGAVGAGLSTTAGRVLECLILLRALLLVRGHSAGVAWRAPIGGAFRRKAALILLPSLLSDWVWGLGEALYGVIYGQRRHRGDGCGYGHQRAAKPELFHLRGDVHGDRRAGGKTPGKRADRGRLPDGCEPLPRRLRAFGLRGGAGAVGPRPSTLCFSTFPERPGTLPCRLMIAYSAMLMVKVANLNMMCGILPSGGRTDYGLILNAIGTWGIGLPLGYLSAFCWRLPFPIVFLLIQSEECVRMVLGWMLMKRRKWMRVLTDRAQA